jgi:hypothetical protein
MTAVGEASGRAMVGCASAALAGAMSPGEPAWSAWPATSSSRSEPIVSDRGLGGAGGSHVFHKVACLRSVTEGGSAHVPQIAWRLGPPRERPGVRPPETDGRLLSGQLAARDWRLPDWCRLLAARIRSGRRHPSPILSGLGCLTAGHLSTPGVRLAHADPLRSAAWRAPRCRGARRFCCGTVWRIGDDCATSR